MRRQVAAVVIGTLALGVVLEGAEMQAKEGAAGFDFWMGSWKVHNRRLRERLKGSTTWDEFDATADARPLLGGAGNEDVFRTEFAGGFTGMSFRFFDNATGKWSIYWANSRNGRLEPPVVGGFKDNVGVFEGPDTFEGRPIRVRYIWSRIDTPTPRWEQAFSEDEGKTWETNWVMDMTRHNAMASRDYPVVELRRYAIKPGERDRFARAFDAYFPEAFQQAGAIAFGQFLERRNDTWFTWLRGFPSYEARAEINGAFYNGVLWKERAAETNARLLDSGNVLLLRPLTPDRALKVLPAVDAAEDSTAPAGIVVLQVLAVKTGMVEAAAREAESAFAAYRGAGVHEAGVLVTLDAPNNFPRHPVRTDGPHLVWVGVVKDQGTFDARFGPLSETAAATLSARGLLREAPETVLLDPTRRSRLRWQTQWN